MFHKTKEHAFLRTFATLLPCSMEPTLKLSRSEQWGTSDQQHFKPAEIILRTQVVSHDEMPSLFFFLYFALLWQFQTSSLTTTTF